MHTSSVIISLLSVSTARAFQSEPSSNNGRLQRRQGPPGGFPGGVLAPGVGPAPNGGSFPSPAPGIGPGADAGGLSSILPGVGPAPAAGVQPSAAPGVIPIPGVGAVPSGGPDPSANGPDDDTHPKGGKGGGGGGGWGGWGGGPGGGPGGGNGGGQGGGACPAIWTTVVQDLQKQFTTNGKCNDLARGAIRAAFVSTELCPLHNRVSRNYSTIVALGRIHLATPLGAMAPFSSPKKKLGDKRIRDWTKSSLSSGSWRRNTKSAWQISFKSQEVSCLVDHLGPLILTLCAAVGIKSCPGGPTVQTYVGRKDRSTANPEGNIPNPNSPAQDIIKNMGDKGFSPTELVALIGSHTAAKQLAFDPSKSGAPLDNTVDQWDVKYYDAVLKNQAPFILPSDRVLANDKTTSSTWRQFAGNQQQWNAAFAPA